ncbi:methyl-accepting chemotaxis protein [Shewanella glacialimarina]|uniref:methyl-accepting chemotaxis protein n=1 Tax=Shewanella glacialimarina TaxID=2590884 RepID=UPI001CF90343|nr:methyl-accepting chemotaxis protein [Shewanella glacialimarina]UCX04798.1 methyl-accepting chemotaxis protein [Shewanella glacialimarina]
MKRWLSRHLSVLTLVPVIALILFICADIVRAYGSLDQANKTIADATLVTATSNLVHELQKERGMSAGFIGSKGVKFAAEIKQQRIVTDKEIQNLINFIDKVDMDTKSDQEIAQLINHLQRIEQIRRNVDSIKISLTDVLSYYTINNQIILDLNGYLASQLKETTSAGKFLTLYNISYVKEQAGIERAILNSVFASDTFTPALFSSFIERVTKQNTYIKSTYTVASTGYRKILDDFVESTENREVLRFREIAEKNSGFNVDASSWFAAATLRIDALKVVEQKLLDEIYQYATDKVNSRLVVILVESAVLILMLVLAYAVYSTLKLRALQSYEINRFMKKIDTEKDLTDSVEIMTEDELGRIAKLINITFSNIRKDFASFQENAHKIGVATIQASSASKESKDSLMQLQIDISSIASATEQMNASIKSVMENMLIASDEAANAAKETVNGEVAVKTSMLGVSRTAEEVARVGDTITELNTRVNDILGMVDVIKSVAEQTNLLALNAAIEAARAGEQGRGFAVVADEVRSLAQRTQRSTEEISGVVDVLKRSSQKAFSSIESGNQQAREAVVNAQKISAVLDKIVNNIKSVDDVTRVIAISTQEQSDVIQDINSNVGSINDQARKNVVGAEQLSASSLQLSQIAKDMESRIQVYKF